MSDFMMGNPDTGSISVPFSDDEAEGKAAAVDEDEDEDKPGASPEERLTRRQKQRARTKALLEEGRKAAERVKELETRDQQRERDLAELRGRVAANEQHLQRQAQPRDDEDPYKKELDAIYERQQAAFNAAQGEIKAGTFDEKRQRYYEGVAREIEEAKTSVHTRRALAQQEPVRRAEQGQQRWVAQYPDVYRNPQAYAFAEATFARKRALLEPGQQPTDEMVHDAMREAMTQFKLGPRTPPSASDRQRLSGIASSGSGGGSSNGPPGIQMTPELRRIAIAAYSDLPEEEALKKWTNRTGKRMREKKAL